MSARLAYELLHRLTVNGIPATLDQADILRRAQMTLHRWGELECGDGNDYQSWSIERDEKTGKPFMCHYPHQGRAYRRAIPDRERGALERVKRVCAQLGLHYWHQTDPRGCSLYVSRETLTDSTYNRGISCA